MKNDFLLAICRAGYYSTNYGVEPCKKCPKGTYQEMEQQTQCHSCPSGTHTKDTGSTSLDYCLCKFARKPLNITSRKAREVVFQAHTHKIQSWQPRQGSKTACKLREVKVARGFHLPTLALVYCLLSANYPYLLPEGWIAKGAAETGSAEYILKGANWATGERCASLMVAKLPTCSISRHTHVNLYDLNDPKQRNGHHGAPSLPTAGEWRSALLQTRYSVLDERYGFCYLPPKCYLHIYDRLDIEDMARKAYRV